MDQLSEKIYDITHQFQQSMQDKEETIPSFYEVVGANFETLAGMAKIKALITLLENTQVHYFRDLSSYHHSYRKVVIFVKRLIRKMIRFMIEPIVEENNRIHQTTIEALKEISEQLDYLHQANMEKQDQETQQAKGHKSK